MDKKIARVSTDDCLEDLVESRLTLVSRKEDVEEQIASKRAALGLSEAKDLRKLTKDKYLELRLKTLAVKQRLRAKLQARKFELERVDRAEKRVSKNGMFSQSQNPARLTNNKPREFPTVSRSHSNRTSRLEHFPTLEEV